MVVSVRPVARERDRCPYCRRRCPGYDLGEGRRRWRALDFGDDVRLSRGGRTASELQASRRGRRRGAVGPPRLWLHSLFEDQVAWLTVQDVKTAVAQLIRVAWRTVGWICERVTTRPSARDLFAGLKRIGIDEISIRKGQRYLTVVVDHDTGRLVWAGPGRDRKTVEKFLDLLGKDRCPDQAGVLRHGHLDHRPGRRALPERNVCYDPFHLIKLSTDALDEIRREVWNDARQSGQASSPRSSRAPGSRCGRTRKPDRAPAAQARPVRSSTSGSTAPTCSPNSCARSTASPSIKRSPCSTAGWRGPDDAASQPFVKLARTITEQRRGSKRRFATGCRTPGSSK